MPLESAAETGQINNIRNRATGIVNNDLIYSQVEIARKNPCRRFLCKAVEKVIIGCLSL